MTMAGSSGGHRFLVVCRDIPEKYWGLREWHRWPAESVSWLIQGWKVSTHLIEEIHQPSQPGSLEVGEIAFPLVVANQAIEVAR